MSLVSFKHVEKALSWSYDFQEQAEHILCVQASLMQMPRPGQICLAHPVKQG